MPLRLTATTIPFWQLGLSLGLLFLASVGMIWLMARLFRAQTLLSGEALSLRRLWSALRSSTA
jgi:ABC-2 type transport system permease protein